MPDIKAQNETALASVKAIYDAADEANTLLDGMQTAATQAGTTLNGIYATAVQAEQSASDAQADADQAKASAENAQASAIQAHTQLSFVEDIVGVLDLVSKNGTYELTSDTEVQSNKWYFTREGTSPNYTYSVVNNPTGDPNAQGWYELTGIDQAIQNYVSSHLVLTSNGLSLRTDGSNYRLDLTTTGMNIIGANGQTLASYGTSTVVGDASGFHVQIDSGELGFYQGSNRVAYINGNRLYITQSVVLQQMDVGTQVSDGGLGQWSWKVHEVNDRNNLYLKWLG